MQFPIARLPDSLILAKAEKIGRKLSTRSWQLTATGEQHQLFVVETAAKKEGSAWDANGVAKRMAESSGSIARSFSFQVDGRHVFSITRADNRSNDDLSVSQNSFNNDEAGRLTFVESVGVVTAEFGVSWGPGELPNGLSNELGRFVETRDQSLARLEELYSRFTQQVFEERSRTLDELKKKSSELDAEAKLREAALQKRFDDQESELRGREKQLEERIRKIDDRDAKHARRELRDKIIGELEKRDTKFGLTEGTRRLRWPVALILGLGGAVFVAGLFHNAVTAETVFKNATALGWTHYYFVLKQLTYTAGLLSVIWYAVKWSDRWFREHASEEFKSKTMRIDILRANWVVETLLEWRLERGQEIPPELLSRLTHNLFRYPDERTADPDGAGLAAVLLGAASKARLKVGQDNELELSRKGARELSDKLAE